MSTAQFGDLFQFIRNGMNVKQDKSERGLPITRIETISDAFVDETRVGYADLEESDCAEWLLQPGDILFSHINSVEHIGKCAIYRGQPAKLVHGMNLLCLRCSKDALYPEFAKYLIRGSKFRTRLSNFINKAVNQASVSIGNLKTIPVSIPSLPEQRRIAEVLDQVEALRAMRRAALAQLDNLTRSLFLDMFGDPTTNPKRWPKNHIGKLVDSVATWNPLRETLDADFVYIDISSINADAKEVTEPRKVMCADAPSRARQHVKTGDVLVSTVRPNLNAVAIIPQSLDGATASTGFCVLRPNKRHIEVQYLFWHVRSVPFISALVRQATGASYPAVNDSMIKSIELPTPPLILQKDFACRANAIQKMKETHRASLVELDKLFASLQHRAFRGEL